MHIFFSGIGGVGIGPLAQIAHDAGYRVSGSDIAESDLTKQLRANGISVTIGQETATIEQLHQIAPIDWFVHTAALPADHPELQFAQNNAIRSSKRDELLAYILDDKQLQLIAVAGTHGKTTTTAMLIWLFLRMNIPISYSVGSTLAFAHSGKFDPLSRYFIYECDEFDRNFLHFKPYMSLITSIDYDHPDIYPTKQEYKDAFVKFFHQSESVYCWQKDFQYLTADAPYGNTQIFNETEIDMSALSLAGKHNRRNALLASILFGAITQQLGKTDITSNKIFDSLNAFPGTGRRFEELAPNIYSDYGHHPVEIAATLQMAHELAEQVVLVYQPHQNTRQHKIMSEYRDALLKANEIYWLPTYLSREDAKLPVLKPEDFIALLSNNNVARVAEMNHQLWSTIISASKSGKLVLLMGAGSVDNWARQQLNH